MVHGVALFGSTAFLRARIRFLNLFHLSSPDSLSQYTATYNRSTVHDDLDRRIVDFFDSQPTGIAAVYLFGSSAQGTARAHSDVDIGILFSETPPSTFEAQPYALEADLERLLGRPVDVVVLNRAPVDLRWRVLRAGRLLIERDRSARIQFEIRTRNEAFDLEPVLREYRMPPKAHRDRS